MLASPLLILFHGLGATMLSWMTFRRHIDAECAVFEYDSTRPAQEVIKKACEKIGNQYGDREVALVGHSFGGVIAWHVAKDPWLKVTAGISIASPWGGSALADTISLAASFVGQHFFSNVGHSQVHLREPRKRPPQVPWLNVVATRGIFLHPPNDGVLTVTSQESIYQKGVETVYLNHSHGEILQSKELTDHVVRFLQLKPSKEADFGAV